jgi:16S rRNA (uracil1498-N3)-methyltransferase
LLSFVYAPGENREFFLVRPERSDQKKFQQEISFPMQIPFFYIANSAETGSVITLDEDTSKHIVGVLRMQHGEQIHLTNGKGTLLTAQITAAHKKRCEVSVINSAFEPYTGSRIAIAISLLKNNNRFEWFLEKATEIGIADIVPLICERTERQHFRLERMQSILQSAMLQSRQLWLPVLHEPLKFDQWINQAAANMDLFIAHCDEQHKQPLTSVKRTQEKVCICIGPEGDFSKTEIELALQQKYVPVALGDTRLRSETAGVVAAVLLKLGM